MQYFLRKGTLKLKNLQKSQFEKNEVSRAHTAYARGRAAHFGADIKPHGVAARRLASTGLLLIVQ